MTLNEIARIAGVSPSTVSKVMNGKDASLKPETREKVLTIAKEYNYIPYSGILRDTESKKFLIGVVVGDEPEDELLFRGISREAGRSGYSVVLCRHDGTLEGELKAVSRLCIQRPDGVIWRRVCYESSAHKKYLDEKGIACLFCDFLDGEVGHPSLYQDFEKLGYAAAAYLIEKKHKKLGCLIRKGHPHSNDFAKGFQRCLYERRVKYRSEFLKEWDDDFSIRDFILYGVTAMVCFDEQIADDVMKQAVSNSYKIPEDVSVIALSYEDYGRYLSKNLTSLMIPERELGEAACTDLIEMIENHKLSKLQFNQPIKFLEGGSATQISGHRMKKIVVAGSINMDAVVNIDRFPESGQTVIAEQFNLLPGGKGSNQAVGVARLGAMSYLIGVVGQDYEAKKITDAMHQAGVYTEGMRETGAAGTGKAYIMVQENGESNIIIYPGANQQLSPKDIQMNSHIFEDSVFCLLQTEIPMKTLEYAAKMATDNGAKVILKPAVPSRVSEYLLKRTDIFAPNEKEMWKLIPEDIPLEKKAQYFLDKGVQHVIVTLGDKGCYLRDCENSLFFSAADFEAVDTTGAADAFLACLAVCLAEGFPMKQAIKSATYAAGLSITRQGAQSSLVDRQTLEMYNDEIKTSIQVWEGK